MYAVADRIAGIVARLFAYLGGLMLIALVVMACTSIIGRWLIDWGLNQIEGDFEMMELGVGFAIFAFLPWTQYSMAHARVDLLEPLYGRRLSLVLDLVAQVLMAGAAILIAWRLWLGMVDKQAYGETSMILQLPVWQAYAAGFAGACGFAFVALFTVWRSLRAFRTPTPIPERTAA